MAEFLTVNLGSILRSQSIVTNATDTAQEKEPAAAQEKDLSGIIDWAKELKDRLANNRLATAGNKVSDYEVEAQFFKDYFHNANKLWDTVCAEQLLSLGDPLKKAIKVLGFNSKINPILGFITNSYVVNKLIKTKLLNVNTFKAIYNAVSKGLVAHTEFMKSNDSNIIYCQDLYKKPVSEIMAYLEIQAAILKPTASAYTAKDIEKNKKVFFQIKAIKDAGDISAASENTLLPSAKSASTKLNSLAFTKALSGSTAKNKDSTAKVNTATALARKIISNKGNNKAKAFAAIQYLSTTTNVPEAKAALRYEAFKNIPIETFIAASIGVTELMKEVELPEAEIKSFISLLLNNLKS